MKYSRGRQNRASVVCGQGPGQEWVADRQNVKGPELSIIYLRKSETEDRKGADVAKWKKKKKISFENLLAAGSRF